MSIIGGFECPDCNGEGATYIHHSYGVEINPCENQTCRMLRSQDYKRTRKALQLKIAKLKVEFANSETGAKKEVV